MFGPLGFPELVFILVLALLIFGPKRLPEVGRTIGKGMAQFRRATTDLKRTIEEEIDLEGESPRRGASKIVALPPPRQVRRGSEADPAPTAASASAQELAEETPPSPESPEPPEPPESAATEGRS